MEIFYTIAFFILGSVMGSFYNVLGLRVPNHQSIISPGSSCEKCGHQLKWYELIPIFSYIFLGGKCYNCKTKLSWLYPFTEIFCGILFTISYYSYGFSLELLIALILSSLLIMVIVSDLTYMIIPDSFIIGSSVLIIIMKLLMNGFDDTLIACGYGLISFLLMFMIMKIGNFLFKKECLGGADIKLMFVVGLILPPVLAILVIVIASFIALPVSLFLLYYNREHVIPFGPFIVVGLLILYFTKINMQDVMEFLTGL